MMDMSFPAVMLRIPQAQRHAFARMVSRELFDAAPFCISSIPREMLAAIIDRVARRMEVAL